MPKTATLPETKDKKKEGKKDKPADGGWRETVESIAMAVILALLFRGFVAEAFVIPTGSMAPTLMGRHKDVECPECGKWYATGASSERSSDGALTGQHVTTTTCPICRYTQRLDLFQEPDDRSFSGDRIIVSKFAYELGDPARWDVIVFKFPGEATINYIKRLIGLPGETIRICGGNIYVKKNEESVFRIARKPAGRLNAMLQLVDDSDHIPPRLAKVGWPTRWQEWPAPDNAAAAWKTADHGRSFSIEPQEKEVWLRYRHIVPSPEDWEAIMQDKLPADAQSRRGSLITDFSAYNAPNIIKQNPNTRPTSNLRRGDYDEDEYDPALPGPGEPPERDAFGLHWADDLAIECDAQVEGSAGELTLDLVQAGIHHRCRINLADGKAQLTMSVTPDKAVTFESEDGDQKAEVARAQTSVKGPGKYKLRLSNIDRQVLLWVNGNVVQFDQPTTYECDALLTPFWTPEDPLDLAPAGIAARGCRVKVSSLKVYRDIYYIAVDYPLGPASDYTETLKEGYFGGTAEAIHQFFASPQEWEKQKAFFTTRRAVQFELHEDEFFPMGDNSSHSSDARIWNSEEHFVHRDLLIGRAMVVYWPHTWNTPVWFTPNPGAMRRIR